MSVEFSVPLSDIVNDLKLNEVYVAENYEDIADLLDEIYENGKFKKGIEQIRNFKKPYVDFVEIIKNEKSKVLKYIL